MMAGYSSTIVALSKCKFKKDICNWSFTIVIKLEMTKNVVSKQHDRLKSREYTLSNF